MGQRSRTTTITAALAALVAGLAACTSAGPTTLPPARPAAARPAAATVAPAEIAAVSFVGPRVGFALDAPPGADRKTTGGLARSDDGGATWSRVGALPPGWGRYAGPASEEGLGFVGPTHGYVWDASEVWTTSDGGRRWVTLPPPPGGWTPDANQAGVAGSVLWVVEGCLGPGTGPVPCSSRVDSWDGRRWRPSAPLPGTLQVGAVALEGSDDATLLAVGADAFDFTVLTTTDGGRRWSASPAPPCAAADTAPDAVAGWHGTVLVECVGGRGQPTWTRRYWARTADGPWTERAPSASGSGMSGTTAPGRPGRGSGTTWPEGTDGTLAAGDGRFFVSVQGGTIDASADGAATWTPSGIPAAAGPGAWQPPDFAGRSDAWTACWGAGVWRSTDGGVTWRPAA